MYINFLSSLLDLDICMPAKACFKGFICKFKLAVITNNTKVQVPVNEPVIYNEPN